MVQSFLVEADSLQELDRLLDEFLKDKEPRDIVDTNLTVYISPYNNNRTTYTAFITYNGRLKGSKKEPVEMEGATVTIIQEEKPVLKKKFISEKVKAGLANKHVWIFVFVWASIFTIGYLIYRWVFPN